MDHPRTTTVLIALGLCTISATLGLTWAQAGIPDPLDNSTNNTTHVGHWNSTDPHPHPGCHRGADNASILALWNSSGNSTSPGHSCH